MGQTNSGDDRRPGQVDPGAIDRVALQYDRPVLFYLLATALPWVLWFAAAYLSHRPDQTLVVLIATLVFSVAGLLAPLAVVAV